MTSNFPDGRVVEGTDRAAQSLLDTIQRDLGTAGSYLCDWLNELVEGHRHRRSFPGS